MMNRRDFLKLTSLLGLVPIRKVVPMAMLSELMMKVVDGNPLSPLEREDLRQMLQEVDNNRIITSTWQRTQDKKMNTDYLDLPFVPIVSQVFEQDLAEFTIQIPSSYKHLLIMGQGRINGTGAGAVFVFGQFNGDTGVSNYQFQNLSGTAGSPAANADLTHYGVMFAYLTADTVAAGHAGSFFTFIPHYNSGYYKSILTTDGIFTASGSSVAVWTSQWLDTSPIISIRIFPDTTYPSGKFEAGSLISVYGIQ